MPFEELDKKISEAADNHHPAYDEKAWNKMEGLLNKHLPEKKDKRRVAFLLLLLLITLGGGYLLLTKINTGKPVTITAENAKQPHQKNEQAPADVVNSATKELSLNENVVKQVPPSPVVNSSLTRPEFQNQHRPLSVIQPGKNKFENNSSPSPDNLNKQNIKPATDPNLTLNPDPSINKSDDKSFESPVSDIQAEIKTVEKEKQLTNAPGELLAAKSQKGKTKKGNELFISLSAGPDIGGVGLDNFGKLKLAAGVGIGYKFSNRVSLQTGFYTARKIYTAAANDYNAPDWWWLYYPTLESVEADCKVYEIPLLLNYNFTQNKKGIWFGTVGLSSYLMKKENYNYHYKTSTGQPATRNWVYNNANKHYFSVITLAGGYERNLNKNMSVSISPYFKMPWQGVGFGKVKLNSAGVMMSANFKPFVKK